MPIWGDGRGGEFPVAGLVGGIGQEVEHGPVVPQREAACRRPPQEVCVYPVDPAGGFAQPLAGQAQPVTSSTVTSVYPRCSSRSTSTDAPPPTSRIGSPSC